MGRVFRPHYTKNDGKGGRVRVQVRNYYAEYTDAKGDQRREKIGPDRRAAESALARLQEQAARAKYGIPDPIADSQARGRPLSELVAEYLEDLLLRDTDAYYRAEVARQLDTITSECRWHVWSDVNQLAFTRFLLRLREGTQTKRGVSPTTLNNYLRTAKGFAHWYAELIEVRNPLSKLKAFNTQVDKRRSRRVLTDQELNSLLIAAEGSRRDAQVSGRDRAALYRVAAFTGLRASELASLTPESFDLAACPPTVTVEARSAKGRRREPIPLHPELVEFLKAWLVGREVLWPGPWAKDKRQARWIISDAKRAGLGGGVIFSSLRRKFVTGLIRSGADVDEVRRLARHTDVKTTLDHYAETTRGELSKAVTRLPSLANPLPNPCAVSGPQVSASVHTDSTPSTTSKSPRKRAKPRKSRALR